mmetsp:Transcript_8167/g.37141  ORF Transcript_8167/g.37141 Transcript_8167/m.37141 type:complete len:208 (-) Transcript_8167:1529-2152(-)
MICSDCPSRPLNDVTKVKLVNQIEFYFSDSNLPRDKFLRETVENDPEGFVDIALLVTFTRVRSLLGSSERRIDGDLVAAVAVALDASTQLTVSCDKKRVRRNSELRPRAEVDAEVEQRSLYVSPFPMDVTIDELRAFFSQHVEVLSIRLRRHAVSKDFKGSIFVELESATSCATLLRNSKALDYQGAELIVMTKTRYLEKKKGTTPL